MEGCRPAPAVPPSVPRAVLHGDIAGLERNNLPVVELERDFKALFKSSISSGVRLSFNNRLIGTLSRPSADANKTRHHLIALDFRFPFTAAEPRKEALTLRKCCVLSLGSASK
jgi:hypothetical protein